MEHKLQVRTVRCYIAGSASVLYAETAITSIAGGAVGTALSLQVALQQLSSKEAFDVLRNTPLGTGPEGWRRLQRRYDPSTSQRKRVMLRTILNPGKATQRPRAELVPRMLSVRSATRKPSAGDPEE
eukprot:1623310-Amphidinium_carterae.1